MPDFTYIKGPTLIESVTAIATAGGTSVFTGAEDTNVQFTGTMTQTVTLADATFTPLGRVYNFYNDSTGPVTINDFTNALVVTLDPMSFKRIILYSRSTSAGVWIVSKIGNGTGGGGSGGINYITNFDFEVSTLGYAAYADTPGPMPVDGTGGSPVVTITRSITSPLRGVASGIITKDAANRQGEGVSYDFVIDDADLGKPLQISCDYAISSGTFVDGDIAMYIYDITNAMVIQPSGFNVLNSTINERQLCEFQSNYNSNLYRLCFHVASTSALAYTLKIDNVSVGPSSVSQGYGGTDPVGFTPVTTNFTANGFNISSQKDGPDLIMSGTFNVTGSSPAVAEMSLGAFGVPDNVVIDSSISDATVIGTMGSNAGGGGSAGPYSYFILASANSSKIHFGWQTNSQGPTGVPLNGNTVFSNQPYSFYLRVRIKGWSSNQVLSDSTSTRVVAARVDLVTPTTFSSGTTFIYDTIAFDTHGAYSTLTGLYAAKVPGIYQFSVVGFQNVSSTPSLYLIVTSGGVAGNPQYLTTCSSGLLGSGSAIVLLKVGDTVEVQSDQTKLWFGTGNYNHLSINLISGPTQIAASESITARYYLSANNSYTHDTAIPFDAKTEDSHGILTSPGVFTIPSPGVYLIGGTAQNQTGTQGSFYVIHNGVTASLYIGGSSGSNTYMSGSTIVPCIAGDTLSLAYDASITITGGSNQNSSFFLTRVGNL